MFLFCIHVATAIAVVRKVDAEKKNVGHSYAATLLEGKTSRCFLA